MQTPFQKWQQLRGYTIRKTRSVAKSEIPRSMSWKIDEVVKYDKNIKTRSHLIQNALTEYLTKHYNFSVKEHKLKKRNKSITTLDLLEYLITFYPNEDITLLKLTEKLGTNKSNLHETLEKLVSKDFIIKNTVKTSHPVIVNRRGNLYRRIEGKEQSFRKSNNSSQISQLDIYNELHKKRYITVRGICERFGADYDSKRLKFNEKLREMQKKGTVEIKKSLISSKAQQTFYENSYSVNWNNKYLNRGSTDFRPLKQTNVNLLTEIRDAGNNGWVHTGRLNTNIEAMLNDFEKYGFITWTSWYDDQGDLQHLVLYLGHTLFISPFTRKTIKNKLEL